jgi:hypothetical protein
MTEKESIKIEKYLLDGYKKPNYKLAEKIMEAVEKQLPKKPIEKDSTDYFGNIIDTVFICSECNRFICYGVETQPEKDYPYCHCGQKIDWSDTE